MKHNTKKKMYSILTLCLIACLLLNGTALADNIQQTQNINSNNTTNIIFIDVKNDYWASEEIRSMASRGIISGNPDGSFKPEDSITREQLAKLIALTFGLDIIKPDTPTFSDVNPASWSYAYVEAAKDYLTGYFPLKGKPFFDPAAKATREDVAVALVRAMDLDTENINAEYVISSKFYDYEDISPQLVNEVAVAVENKLINGYPDGTFKPTNPINRASVAALLYRVLKSSYSQATKDIQLDVSIPATVATATVPITGKVTKGARVYINDQEIEQNNGTFNEAYILEDGEGTYEFVIKAVLANGRSRTVKKQVVYETTGPKLTVKVPETSGKPTVKISGKVTDPSDNNPVVTVNDEIVYVSYNGDWSTEVNLKQGINKIIIIAENRSGKNTVVEKQIEFNADLPELTLDNIPETTTSKTITISGRATDANDYSPKIYMNDQYVGSSSFYETVTLKEGENVFRFKTTNNLGKSSPEIVKTIIFGVDGPELTLDNVPETITSKTITLSGRATDANDYSPKIYMNDRYVGSSNFYETVTLKEGVNVFKFKATNTLGKSSPEIVKTIVFSVGGPELTLDNVPETTSNKNVTITGRATDTNDYSPKIYMNDRYVGSSNFYESVTLKEGENVFKFKATNNLGKSSPEIVKTIIFTVAAPELVLDNIPSSTSYSTITITGRASDANDYSPKIYLNDRYISSSNFYETVTLKEGENVLRFKATNSFGKATTIEKTVTYTPSN